MTRTKKSKLLSFLLCFVMVATAFGQIPMIASATETGSDGLQIQQDGEDIDNLTLQKDEKCEIEATGASGDVQWQYYAEDYEMWISIYGETSAKCTLTYAKVCNMLDDNDQTKIRCTQQDGDTTVKSNEVTLTVKEAQDEAAAPARFSLRSAAPMVLSEGSADVDEAEGVDPQSDDPETPATYNVIINYVFENNEIAADPYTANLAAGSNFSATVTFPTIQGYLPYVNDARQDSIELNYTNISQNYTINVVYKPTNVDYTVIHYQQNLNDDNYTEVDRETKQGLTNSKVPEVAKIYKNTEGEIVVVDDDYIGFYALIYDNPVIAADGSTIVEVYYDRYYYLMNFDLDGGYGVEPIYARYGSPIGDVGTPTKAGYTFVGWSLDGKEASLPDTMPAENRTYKAVWTADDTAKVTVVFWGENADDEEYSYIKSAQVNVKPGTKFTYDESGSLVCGQEVHTHDASCEYTCGQEEHQHSIENGCYELTCNKTSHNHVNDRCEMDCKHTHTVDCYKTGNSNWYSLVETKQPEATLTDTGDGIYTYTTGSGRNEQTHYYLNIGDKWYCAETGLWGGGDTTRISLDCNHTHTDECYTCGLTEGNHVHSVESGCYQLICEKAEHTHSDECGYSCGKTAHTHSSDCYMSGAGLDSKLWKFVKSDTVTVAADGSSVVNVYYDRTEKTLTFKYNYSNRNYQSTETITAKWGSDISEAYKKIADNAGSTFWSAKTDGKQPYTNYFGIMPETSATYYNRGKTGSDGTMTYWGQDLNGEYTVKLFEVTDVGGYTVTNEDRYKFNGFTYDHGTSNGSSCKGANFYYTRNSYTLTFNDGYNDVKTESVKYQAPLSTYADYVPYVPSAYESGSVTFGGWYLNPECTGAEYKLDEHSMPADNVLLYAKWVPVTHKVEFYLDKLAMESESKLSNYDDLIVDHGSKVDSVPAEPVNGSYTFVGWFYMEDGVEKAFDFKNMPITKDMKVYGKWSSNVLKNYTIKYMIQDTDTEIAAQTKGSALAGVTKTFDAKGGTDLDTGYQEGYFPITKSHSLTIDINDEIKNVYTFWYVQKEAVPYTVKYLNKETGEPVADEKTVSDNRKAVVTETFVPVSGMMPDAYQKRLVVSAEEGAVNEIIFYYTEDTTHAYYKITHYTENLAKDAQGNTTWTEYASSQAVGDIGTTYTADPMTIPGFTYDENVSGTVVSGELTANGLELKLYYTRNSYPYQVRYLEQGTGNQLADPKDGTGKYGQVISESAIGIADYEAVDQTSQTLNIRIEEGTEAKLNIINFYYKEREALIKYEVVGPDGCGTVSPESETVKIITGDARGSTANANDNFRFVGWYADDACTNKISSDNSYVPAKQDDKNVSATYYAKFEYDLADLTITKQGIQSVDHDSKDATGKQESQSSIFLVTGPDGYSQKVVICGEGSVTIKDLKVGTYKITELTDWSWRYTPESEEKTINLTPDGASAVFKNSRTKPQWLNGGTYKDNKFDN